MAYLSNGNITILVNKACSVSKRSIVNIAVAQRIRPLAAGSTIVNAWAGCA